MTAFIARIVLPLLLTVPVCAQLMLGADPYNDRLRVLDLQGNTLRTTILQLDVGGQWDGTNAVAHDPLTGRIFVCFDATGVNLVGRGLGVLGPIGATTEVTLVGDLGQRFATLAFDDGGTLYGITGHNSPTPEELHAIDTETGATTLIAALGNGGRGEAMAFNPLDGQLYHASGGVLGGPAIWEKVAPQTGAVTPIGYQPTSLQHFEIFGMVFDPGTGEFLALDLDQQLVTISPAGLKSPVADLTGFGFDYFFRGFALIDQDRLTGTADNLATSVIVGAAPETVVPWGGTALSLLPGESFFVRYDSLDGSLDHLGSFIVWGSLLPSGSLATLTEPFPGLHIDFNGVFLAFGGTVSGAPLTLPPIGHGLGFVYPGGLAGQTIVLQAAISAPATINGIFASSQGVRVDFL